MPSRRQFLGVLAAGVAGLVTWRYLGSSDADAIATIVQKRLHYLKLDPDGVSAFANDLVKRQIISTGKLRLIDMAGPVYTHLSSHLEQRPFMHQLKHGEERITSLYLLSSDFFRNGQDASKPVRYIALYDPFQNITPCQTPFARPVHYSAS
ncbi:MAG: twin-arginine translocation signal domain-containing protein [Gammaproteobacteria bacterium]|nr:twin-arginine translocation signal domain-containing protein [Gammaproteobacteria bacterium]